MSNLSYFKYKSKFEATFMEKPVIKEIHQKMTFKRSGCDYKNILFDEEHHCGIWEMTKVIGSKTKFMGYEVVKGIKAKNPDGSIVYCYPGDEQFGVYGFYTHSLDRCKEILDSWLDVKDQSHFKAKDE